MPRADRLFQIVQLIRGRRLTTAAHLAERLGRLAQVQVLEGAQGRFVDEPGKTLADYLRAVAPAHVQATLTGDL